MSCANTSLPWFIDPPRAMLPRGVAKPKFEIQIETKKINRVCVFHQQLTGAESPNVGTLLETDANSKHRMERMEWLGMLAKQVLSGRACANHQEFIEAGVNIHRSKNVVSIVVNQGET